MKRALFLFLFITSSVSISAKEEEVSMEYLQGQWKLEKILRIQEEIAEESAPALPDDNVWIFSKDILTRFNYPLAFIEDIHFRLDSNRLFYDQSRRVFAQLQNDSGKLVATFHSAILIFLRDTFPPDTMNCLNVLKRDTVNPGLMLEKYYMVTHFAPDDEESYDFTPPIKIPHTLNIKDSAEARALIHSGVVYLRAGGQKREFHVVGIDWDGSTYGNRGGFYVMDVPFIRLVPGDWWNGDSFSVIYRANEQKMIRKGSRNVQKVQ